MMCCVRQTQFPYGEKNHVLLLTGFSVAFLPGASAAVQDSPRHTDSRGGSGARKKREGGVSRSSLPPLVGRDSPN